MGGSAFSRCAASSLPCIVSLLHRLSCTVSPALSPLHRLSALSLLHLSRSVWELFPSVLLCSSRAFSAPLPILPPSCAFFFSSVRGLACLRPDSGAPSACAGTRGRKHSLPPANGRRPVVISLPRGGRTCSLRRRVANASPSHVGGHKKRADLAVRSALRFEGRPGISNPATWKPHRKFSGRWHGEAPALRRSRYPSWSSRRP